MPAPQLGAWDDGGDCLCGLSQDAKLWVRSGADKTHTHLLSVWSFPPVEATVRDCLSLLGLALFGFTFFALATAFERDKRNNPAERYAANARLTVVHVVKRAKMNWSPVIWKSGRGAAFA